MSAVVFSHAAADFLIRMASHILERREQLRPLLKAAVDAAGLKRGATRGAPVLERLIADGVAGRFPAEEVDIEDWKEMLKQVQELRLKLRALESAHGSLRCSREPFGRGPQGRELGSDGSAPREACSPEAAPLSHERHCNAEPDRERALRGGGAACQQENRRAAAGLDRHPHRSGASRQGAQGAGGGSRELLAQLADMPAPPPPNEAGGCWKELPETLTKKKALWNPRNEDHRCFMWCVLAHCLGVAAAKDRELLGLLLLYPELTHRRGHLSFRLEQLKD